MQERNTYADDRRALIVALLVVVTACLLLDLIAVLVPWLAGWRW